MKICDIHADKEAKRSCLKCKKAFCEDCAKATDYTELCAVCEHQKQIRILDYAKKKQHSNLSNAIASGIGALLFLLAHFLFDDFKLVGIIGLCVLGFVCALFTVLSVDNGTKIRSAKNKIAKLDVYIGKEKNRGFISQK